MVTIHRLRLGLGVGSGLVPSYYPIIVIAIISTWYVHAEQDCKIKCYWPNILSINISQVYIEVTLFSILST